MQGLISKLMAATVALLVLSTAPVFSEPVVGGVLRIAQDESPDRIDPHFAVTVQHRLIIDGPYEALLEMDNDFNILPSLATEYVMESPTSFLFTLREGVKFHDGSPLTVDDVVFTFERIMSPDKPGPSQVKLKMIESVTPAGANQVRINLKNPSAPFLRFMADPTISGIVSRKFTMEHNNDLSSAVNGTGAFKVTRYAPGVAIVMEKNPDYWRQGLPYLDRINIEILPDDSTRLATMRTGETDMTMFRPDKLRLIDTLKGVVKSPMVMNSPEFTLLNCNKPPFDKKEVRQAFSLALDRSAIAATVMPKVSKLGMWISAADKVFGYQGDGLDVPLQVQDVARARELMAAAGYADGVDVAVDYIGTPAFQIDARISEIMQQQLAVIGIRLTLRPLEYPALLTNFATGNYQAQTSGRGIEADPDSPFSAEAFSGSPLVSCKDKTLDAMLQAQQQEMDIAKRAVLIDEIQRYISEEAYRVYLFHMPLRVELWRENVKGYTPNPLLRRTSLRETYIEK